MISRRRRVQFARLRRRVYSILERTVSTERAGVLVHAVLIGLVLASVTAIILESVPEIEHRYGPVFMAIEDVAVAVFTVEYALRLWSAPEHAAYTGLRPWTARLRFAATPSAIVDLLSIAPIYLELFVATDLKVLLLLRLARFFKLARYSPGMRSLLAVLDAERKALFATAVVLLGLVLVAAAAMHLVEHDAQPAKFGSIPAAMWWAVETLTTVGYGEVVPVTFWGRIIASVTMLLGIMTLALPIGIVATSFAEEIHRREFVVTWSLIAGVPLFKSLNAAEIADIMRYLRAQTVPPGAVVVRRGDEAQGMYFIASGEVEVELPDGPVKLSDGQFFGEMALLRKTRRSATVRALRSTKLLILEASDFNALVERKPDIGRRIEAVAQARAQETRASFDSAPAEQASD